MLEIGTRDISTGGHGDWKSQFCGRGHVETDSIRAAGTPDVVTAPTRPPTSYPPPPLLRPRRWRRKRVAAPQSSAEGAELPADGGGFGACAELWRERGCPPPQQSQGGEQVEVSGAGE